MSNYVTMDTKEWIFSAFIKMSDSEFSYELSALMTALNLYLTGNECLVDSFVREYLDTMYDIARDALVYRYLHHDCFDLTNCMDCSNVLIVV